MTTRSPTPETAARIRDLFAQWKDGTKAGRIFSEDYDRSTTPYPVGGRWRVDGRHKLTGVWWHLTFTDARDSLSFCDLTKVSETPTRV